MLLKGVVPRGRISIRVPAASAEHVAEALSRMHNGERALTGGM